MNPALWVLGFGPWLLGQGNFGISVEAAAPDAFCPALQATREAVRARVGTIEVPDGGAWRALYTIVHSPGAVAGNHIRLELRDPSGALKLERDIPSAGESCSTLAQILALVIERYFRELTTARPDTTGDFAEPAAPDAPKGATRAPPAAVTRARPAEPPQSLPTREAAPTRVLVGGLFGGASTATRSPGLGLGVRLRLGAVARVRTSLLIPVRPREEALGAGTLTLEEYPFRAAFTAALETEAWDFELGPEILLALERGAAEGLPNASGGFRCVPGLGVRGGVTYWATPRFGVDFGLSADAVVPGLTSPFAIGGRDVLVPAPVRGLLELGVVWSMMQ